MRERPGWWWVGWIVVLGGGNWKGILLLGSILAMQICIFVNSVWNSYFLHFIGSTDFSVTNLGGVLGIVTRLRSRIAIWIHYLLMTNGTNHCKIDFLSIGICFETCLFRSFAPLPVVLPWIICFV